MRCHFVVSAEIQRLEFADTLLQIVKGIDLDPVTKIGDIISSAQEKELLQIIRKVKLRESGFLSDGRKELLVELPLTGEILDLITPTDIKPGEPVVQRYCPCCGQPWPKGRPVPAGLNLLIKDEVKEEYTGIVFDCSSFLFKPVLFPRVINESGDIIYDLSFADRSQVVSCGLVNYLHGDDQLLVNERVGKKPLRVKVIKILNGNLVITNRDGKIVHGSKRNLDLLRQCRVSVIAGY
ncbi:hypothetical protein DRP53_05020 [candidate division WOR-3 bacterium]|uniref:Uncharacterized protein n=1 Tax=candidate division WOR-3 bacterium TaxID=2052148 RepID=A0A660SHZ9_UNCW3|nr:MAG: hypothetical protein DRP53_05020 [candidate division WOR-3 bacterium]